MSITMHRSAERFSPLRQDLPLVAVFVGTDHHPFDRVLTWAGEVLPGRLSGAGILPASDMAELLDRADAVVTHAGPGMIMEARAAGHLPIVVPRTPGSGSTSMTTSSASRVASPTRAW